MTSILPAPLRDRTIDFVTRGYRFMDDRRRESTDPRAGERVAFGIFGSKALLVRGTDGVRLFYDTSRMKRHGAMPKVISGPLFGTGAIHGLDDEQHRHRKALFVGVAMDPDALQRLREEIRDEWERTIDRWEREGGGEVYRESARVFGRAVIRWAGIEVDEDEANARADDFADIVDGFGVVGPEAIRARLARVRTDRWASRMIREVRVGNRMPPADSALARFAAFTDLDGEPLSEKVAGVELQNVLRPTVAVCRFASFAALALHENPRWVERIRRAVRRDGTTISVPEAVAFAQEVRRVYPFVPMLPAKARSSFEWKGKKIEKGQRVLIDIAGTDRDPQAWPDPTAFDPLRFLDADGAQREDFVPQGGGDVRTGHRCPGEHIAVGALAITVAELAMLDAKVPPQDLSFDVSRMPTRPGSGVRYEQVKRAQM